MYASVQLDESYNFANFVTEFLMEEFASVVKLEWLMWGVALVWIAFPEDAYAGVFLFFAAFASLKQQSQHAHICFLNRIHPRRVSFWCILGLCYMSLRVETGVWGASCTHQHLSIIHNQVHGMSDAFLATMRSLYDAQDIISVCAKRCAKR